MNITVKTNALKEQNGSTLAIANVEFGDQIKIKNITVKDGKNGRFVSMPSYQTNKVDEQGNSIFQDVFNPITASGRESLYGAILESLDTGKEITINNDSEKSITAKMIPIGESKYGVVGVGRLYLNEDFVVNNITVRESKEGNLYVSYPSYKTNEADEQGKAIYKDFVYPKDKESRDMVSKIVLDAYTEAKEIVKVPMQKEEVKEEILKEEKPKGIKAKLKEGEEKSKALAKSASTPKRSKEMALE